MNIVVYASSEAACIKWSPDWYYGRGTGGAEGSIILMAEQMVKMGHRVRVYNGVEWNVPRNFNGVIYTNKSGMKLDLSHEPADVVLFYRKPDHAMTEWLREKCPQTRQIAFSTDQYTEGDYFQWLDEMDKLITISPYHRAYMIDKWNALPEKTVYTDLPVNAPDYVDYNDAPRGHAFLWCSQAQRGLDRLALVWDLLKMHIPDASLFITASHKLWGVNYEGNDQYRALVNGMEDVHFLSDIPREKLATIQRRCSLVLGPLSYEELFCVAVSVSQAAGCIPVVSNLGALETTVMVGTKVLGDPLTDDWLEKYVESIMDWANNPDLQAESRRAHQMAMERFNVAAVTTKFVELLK